MMFSLTRIIHLHLRQRLRQALLASRHYVYLAMMIATSLSRKCLRERLADNDDDEV